jgi:hypothetical protein
MLETDGVLRTWALAEEPRPGKPIAAELLPDHRLDYLDYEGPVSRDRGSVSRWDAGEYAMIAESPTKVAASITGARIRGTIVLEKNVDSAASERWTLQCSASDRGREGESGGGGEKET